MIDATNRDTVRFSYHFDAFSGVAARAATETALSEDLDYAMIDAVVTSLRAVD